MFGKYFKYFLPFCFILSIAIPTKTILLMVSCAVKKLLLVYYSSSSAYLFFLLLPLYLVSDSTNHYQEQGEETYSLCFLLGVLWFEVLHFSS